MPKKYFRCHYLFHIINQKFKQLKHIGTLQERMKIVHHREAVNTIKMAL